MPVTTDKITDTVASRVDAARQLVGTKVLPYAVPVSRKAARQAAKEARKQMIQARELVQEKLAPMASAAVENAMVSSAPMRYEAMRRGKLAAAALRGADVMTMKKRRRWPIAIACLMLGSAVGAAAAWLSQAGKPVQLTPYPLPSQEKDDKTVDLTFENETRQGS
jgi:hypothetical protein